MSENPAEFVRRYAQLAPVSAVPEIRLYQAAEPIGLWELTEGEFRSEQPPPFWAFAWAGGQALARYLLDHPETVAGQRVLDLASGSGLVAIAAARAGATQVRAVDIDRMAVAAVEANAGANGVAVAGELGDILDADAGGAQVVLAGDVFYSQAMANRVLRFLIRAARAGARVLVGDPERAYLPRGRFQPLAGYDIPVTVALESVRVKHSRVWELTKVTPATGGPGQRAGTG
ncbi:class I SAM-dependent methyltransferase [Plantactinospora sp. KLBMP9567]|uniref:class I SAM-dependent methyltransferase n=1 Tax=Plantactinospora sp. KLBMP9567 TaxID=3085900 RepID=UPI002982747B|nr:50S ribosomal protein L11 methyltransferase [Plantactinospora sp. KLBMP9567]MDW5326805.1 50S ribosomal protein L11 methyltransferase [Plantactinospora sp. KLBMP9567]